MFAICVVTLLVLMGSDILPSKVHADSSVSSDSRASSGSTDVGVGYCNNALKKLSFITGLEPLPTCTCGSSGTISKVEFFNAKSGTTTVLTCSGCTGPQVPITSSTECENAAGVFSPDLVTFCKIVYPLCTSITFYRCDCPAVTTTPRPTTPRFPG